MRKRLRKKELTKLQCLEGNKIETMVVYGDGARDNAEAVQAFLDGEVKLIPNIIEEVLSSAIVKGQGMCNIGLSAVNGEIEIKRVQDIDNAIR